MRNIYRSNGYLICYLVIAVALVFVIFGCTGPTQRIAERSMQLGLQQEDTIVQDLVIMAKQFAVDKAVSEGRIAAEATDADAVQVAVQDLATNFEKIGWLQIQHERARGALSLAQQYIWAQRGVLDIMWKEYQEAKEAKMLEDAQAYKDELNAERRERARERLFPTQSE